MQLINVYVYNSGWVYNYKLWRLAMNGLTPLHIAYNKFLCDEQRLFVDSIDIRLLLHFDKYSRFSVEFIDFKHFQFL